MSKPRREIVIGVPDAGPAADLLDQLRQTVEDTFYVALEQIPEAEQIRFLEWLLPQVIATRWTAMLLDVERARPRADGMTKSGRVVSLEYHPIEVWS